MKKLTQYEIKENIFEILSAYADYCDKHGLRYYICGGTLLGAVRHNDFIPWDDDIDVLMPRPDYIKMQRLLKNDPVRPYYRLISFEFGNDSHPFGKIIDTRTTVTAQYNHSDSALWIDIFPMDGVPDDIRKCSAHLKRAEWWKQMYGRAVARFGTGTTPFRALFKTPALLISRIVGWKRCAKTLDALAKTYDFDACDYIAGIAWSRGPRERMKKEAFIPYEDKEFHGRMFHAPACWDDYLKAMYGNYMELPPEDQRNGHFMDVYWKEEADR